VESGIAAGGFDDRSLDDALISDLQHHLCGELTPQLVGWRRDAVQVGMHLPPEPHQVPLLMREYALDLQAQLEAVKALGHPQDGLLEALAFAEGRLLTIHPFADFNGRTTRLFLRLLLRRLDLPAVDLAPGPRQARPYFEALRAGDRRDWRPLMQVWRHRFENTVTGGHQ
jgi:CRISPR-associated endonuclease/helicase Cas3